MASASLHRVGIRRTGSMLIEAAAEQGSASHPWFESAELTSGVESARNLADAVHLLCTLHGRHPGVVDHAIGRTADEEARAWLFEAADGFAAERLYLSRLAVVLGPVPGTPGGLQSEAAVRAQQGAIATLASSERNGCALGAALALVADWTPVRAILDLAAERAGLERPQLRLDGVEALARIADAAGSVPAVERAMMFGAQQILVQHRGLWDLLEARAQARSA